MIIENVRFSYVNLVKPKQDLNGNMRFGAQLLIDKKDTATVAKIKKAIDDAIQNGVQRGKLTPQQAKSPSLRRPIRDGDEQEHNSAAHGHWFINASNSTPPGIVNQQLEPLMTEEDVYSGMYGHADVQFYAYNTSGNMGVGTSLQNVMKTRAGDRLDGRVDPSSAFASYATETERSWSTADGSLRGAVLTDRVPY